MDNAIAEFFDERKAAWLKKNATPAMSEEEAKQQHDECEAMFQLSQWLPNAANRAGQMSIATHPCTFSHPSARKNKNGYASSIIAKSPAINDGFLRTGNVSVPADALGNAAALDVHKFLTLLMNDGQTLIQHIEQDSVLALNLLTLEKAEGCPSYSELKEGFLAMTRSDSEPVTSSKIKQVYFPVGADLQDEQYHQLSLLTASGIVFDLRKRLDVMRFGDETKEARQKRKDNAEHSGYKEIYDLTTIAYGGTKPQNISVLNNRNGGKAHLLMSMPPSFKRRDVSFPRSDFFSQTIRYVNCQYQFYRLHSLYADSNNNKDVRDARDELYQSIVDLVIEKMWQTRSVAHEQYYEASSQLPAAQIQWLCDDYKAQREEEDDWLDPILRSVSQFIFHGYEKIVGKKAILLGDAEYQQIQKIVLRNKEALR